MNGMKRAKPESTFANTVFVCQKQFRCLMDPYAITILDDESDLDEQRFITVGMGAAGRLLTVAYTWRGKNIRIISARPAETQEREEYEAEQ